MKKYIRSYEEYDNRVDGVNPEEADYYDKIFEVNLWSGVGYQLESYLVHSNDAETALEKVVAFCEKHHNYSVIFTDDEIDSELVDMDYYIYVDATMEGASKPYYVLSENFSIKEVRV